MPDILKMIKADHREAAGLLKKLTADDPPADCDALFDTLYSAVMIHLAFEEKEVYPLIKKGKTKDLALEGYEEHDQVKRLLQALHDMDETDETCTAKMNVLKEDLSHHVKEEEGDVHPLIKKATTREERQRLGQRYQKVKDKAKGRDGESEATAKGKKSPSRSPKAGRSR